MSKKVIILGSKGMLGQELAQVFLKDASYETLAWDKEEMDATDFSSLGKRFQEEKPEYVVNAIAYNAVDKCEESQDEFAIALRLNRDLPEFLANMSRENGFTLVHYSTDYVFPGSAHDCELLRREKRAHGYAEDAEPQPISKYGESKLLGEVAVKKGAEKCYIIRLSKLFGKPASSAGAKRSFFDVMLEVGQTKPDVQVVDSERGSFTYAPDLALASKQLLQSGMSFGIYHLVNEGSATWYEAVKELYQLAGMQTKITPVSGDAFPRPAKRPVCSVLINSKFPPLRPYQDALQEYITQIRN